MVPSASSNSALSKLLAYEQLKPRIVLPRVISTSKSGLDLNATFSAPSVSSSDTEWLMLNLIAILKKKN
jgi:hypothetical protein